MHLSHGSLLSHALLVQHFMHKVCELILFVFTHRAIALELDPVDLLCHYVTRVSFEQTDYLVGKTCYDWGHLEARIIVEFPPFVVVFEFYQGDHVLLLDYSVFVMVNLLKHRAQLEIIVVFAT